MKSFYITFNDGSSEAGEYIEVDGRKEHSISFTLRKCEVTYPLHNIRRIEFFEGPTTRESEL